MVDPNDGFVRQLEEFEKNDFKFVFEDGTLYQNSSFNDALGPSQNKKAPSMLKKKAKTYIFKNWKVLKKHFYYIN